MKSRIIAFLLTGYFGLLLLLLLGIAYSTSRTEIAPEQPVAFSHQIHVGKLKLQCTECHTTVDKSPRAGIPPVSKCMSCHEKAVVDRPEVQKLRRYWDNQEPIPWNRVYSFKLRNYVYFSHKRHVKKGIDCAVCHGPVEAMARVRRMSSLQMGWCVSCHRVNGASDDCLICHK